MRFVSKHFTYKDMLRWILRRDFHMLKREYKFFKQRRKFGFDESETWSLDNSIASFIVPRIRMLKEVTPNHPWDLSMEEWRSILGKIERAFVLRQNQDEFDWTEKETKEHQEGLDLFVKYYGHLWW